MTSRTITTQADTGATERRDSRWDALRTLWSESSLPRVRNCRRIAADASAGVVFRVNADGAGLGGVQTCGSTWACPCCSAKIAAVRAGEIAAVLNGWRLDGGSAVLVTLTAQHGRGRLLKGTWDAVGHGWSKVTSGRGWVEDKETWGIGGFVRVVETTFGWDNGWHVHIHALVLTERLLDYEEREALAARLWDRWSSALKDKGYTASKRRGVDVQAVTGEGALGEYFTKATYELTGAGLKQPKNGNITPFMMLALLVETGDAEYLDLWHEWEKASKGRRQLTWSRGLRARYLTAPEADDETIAAESHDGETVAEVSAGTYRQLAESGMVPACLSMAVEGTLLAWFTAHGVPFDVPDHGRTRVPD